MSKHTPRPWEWTFQPDKHGNDTPLIAQAWRIPALLAVVEAAKELREAQGEEMPKPLTPEFFDRVKNAYKSLDAALARVKEGGE